jgi:hypothetical protein
MRVSRRRSLFILAICVGVAAYFSYGSDAVRTRAATQYKPPVIVSGSAPSFGAAARQGVAELIGNGDHTVMTWNPSTGLWGGHIKANWWQSALAMLTLVRYAEHTHALSPVYQRVLLRIYQRNIFKPHSTARRDFANEFMDDTAWWGLAWLEAARYELYDRHDVADATRFLAVAEYDASYIENSPKVCGGIVWALRRLPDTVTSAEFADLTARLSSFRNTRGIFYDPAKARIWLGDARRAMSWLHYKWLVHLRTGTVLDGLDARCHVIGGAMTYTEGEVAEALVQMGIARHDPIYFRYAGRFLRYTLSPASHLTTGGILQEHCEANPGHCTHLAYRFDIPAFKGLFVAAVYDWSRATGSNAFHRFLLKQAQAVVRNAIIAPGNQPGQCQTAASCRFALQWAAPVNPGAASVGATVGGQESGLDALTAVLPRGRGPGR